MFLPASVVQGFISHLCSSHGWWVAGRSVLREYKGYTVFQQRTKRVIDYADETARESPIQCTAMLEFEGCPNSIYFFFTSLASTAALIVFFHTIELHTCLKNINNMLIYIAPFNNRCHKVLHK